MQDIDFDLWTKIGTKIMVLRENCKLTQDMLAEKCGVPSRIIAMLEHGIISVHLETLVPICQSLKVNLTTLFQNIA